MKAAKSGAVVTVSYHAASGRCVAAEAGNDSLRHCGAHKSDAVAVFSTSSGRSRISSMAAP